MARRPRAEFSLTITAASGRDFAAFVQRHLRAAHRTRRNCKLREMNIAFVGEKRMSELHEEFLGVPGPTDVLSFPIDTDSRGRTISGEIVICIPVARREAKTRGIAPRLEVLLYAIHGMLHLCGLDDRTQRDYLLMHRTEDAILTKLGVGAVFFGSAFLGAARTQRSQRANDQRRKPRARRAGAR